MKLHRSGVALLVALVGICAFADGGGLAPAGAVRYVSATGDDGNSGAASSPWRTIQHAADSASPGETVVVRAGKYHGFVLGWDHPQNGSAAAPITFRGEKGATITGRNARTADGINLEGASYIVIEGFTVDNADGSIARAGIRAVGDSQVVILGNTADHCGTWGIFTSHSNDLLIEDNVASHAGKEHGIYVSNACVRPIVRGNRIFGNRGCGLHFNGDASQGGDGLIKNAMIENNIIYDNGAGGGSAINCDGVQDSRIQNNLLYGNHASGISLFHADAAAGSTGNLIVNNTIVMADDARWALNIKGRSTGNAVYNNILLNANRSHGSIDISADSMKGFFSDHNAVEDRFALDDGDSVSVAKWRQSTGQDRHSLIAMPGQLFADPATDDYRLAAKSPAIGAGISLPVPRQPPVYDLTGAARPVGQWDLGALIAPRSMR